MISGAILASSLFYSASASAATTYTFINNYTIKESIVESDGFGDTITKNRYFTDDTVPSDKNLRAPEGRVFEFGNDEEYCSNTIYMTDPNRYVHNTIAKSGTACAADAVVRDISVDTSGIDYLFYFATPNSIKTLSPGKTATFTRVSPQPSDLGSGAAVFVLENGGKCPALLTQYSGTKWGVFAPEQTGTIQTGSDSLYYRQIAENAGYSDVSGCKANGGVASDVANDVLAAIVGGESGYWGGYERESFGGLDDGRVRIIGNAVGSLASAVYILGDDPSVVPGGNLINDTDGAGLASTCEVDAVGWFVCPIMKFMGTLNDAAFEQLSKLLEVEPSLLTEGDSLRDTWGRFRDIANILFVVAFLWIVYGQMVGGRN